MGGQLRRWVWPAVAVGVVLALVAIMRPASANLTGVQSEIGPLDGDGLQIAVCNAVAGNVKSCNSLITGPVYVKGWKIVSTTTNVCAALYDAAAIPTADTTAPKDENCEPAAYNGAIQMWPSPVKFSTAVSVAVLGGNDTTVFVYY